MGERLVLFHMTGVALHCCTVWESGADSVILSHRHSTKEQECGIEHAHKLPTFIQPRIKSTRKTDI